MIDTYDSGHRPQGMSATHVRRLRSVDLEDGSRLLACLEMRTDPEGGVAPSFGVIGKLWRLHGRPVAAVDQERYAGEPDASGMMHAEVLEAFPDLRWFCSMQGCDPRTGMSPNMLEDSRFHYRTFRGLEPNARLDRESALRLACARLRVAEIPLDHVPPADLDAAFHVFFADQRRRWADEARRTREMLEALPPSDPAHPRLGPAVKSLLAS